MAQSLPTFGDNQGALFGDEFNQFLAGLQKKREAAEKFRLGGTEALAAQNVAVGQALGRDDELARQLGARASEALSGINPARFDTLAGRMGGAADRASYRFADDRAAAAGARRQMADTIGRFSDLPSVVDAQSQIARENARRQIASQVASQRGAFSPAAQRAGTMALGQASADIGAQAAAARAAEERAALAAQLGGQAQLRTGDIGQQASDLSAGQALASVLQGQAGVTGMGQSARGALIDAYNQRDQDMFNRWQNALAGVRGLRATEGPGAFELGLGAAGTVGAAALPFAMMSDERAKTEVRDADGDMRRFLDSIDAKGYRYKDDSLPDTGPGRHVGVMAQSLEKTPVGKRIVAEGVDGLKRVDMSPTKLGPIVLGALANLNKRLAKTGA